MKMKEVLGAAKASLAASHREVVKDEPECDALNEGFLLGVAYAADKFKTLEDAEVIGLCPTCKGSGLGGKPENFDPERDLMEAAVRGPCPDCANARVWVIEPAAWEAFVCKASGCTATSKAGARRQWYEEHHGNEAMEEAFDGVWAELEADYAPLFQTLLPGARVAEEIRDNVLGFRRLSQKGLGAYYSDCSQGDGPGYNAREVAILAPQEMLERIAIALEAKGE